MRSAEELRRLIQRGWELPDGAGQIAVAEEALRHADALGDRRVMFAARMLATSAYHRGGEPAKAFVTFSWCLADFDREPGAHDLGEDRLLRWFFKYVISALPKFPQIPLERTYAAVDDMQRRFSLGGHSPHAVYWLRWLLARHVGDEAAADGWYERWCAAPPDENSNCAGCDPTGKVTHLADRGRDEEAVALAEPVLAGRLTCAEQPQAMLTELLLPYLRTGRLEQARDAHRRAYLALRGNVANLGDVAVHLQFCALTGNEVRGLEIVQRHLGWLDRPPSPYAAMEFAASAAAVLGRLAGSGHGDRTLWRRAGSSGAEAEVTVAELAAALRVQAEQLAAQFDARNGTAAQRTRIAERLSAQPLVDDLPLSATGRRPARATAAGDGGRAGDPGGAVAGPSGRGRPAAGAIPELPAESTADELLEIAERHLRRDEMPAARAVLAVFDQRYGDSGLTALQAARRREAHGDELIERRDAPGAERAWLEAAEGYRAAAEELRAQVALGRAGTLRCLTGRAEEGLPLIEESTAYVLAHGTPERRAAALTRTGVTHLATGQPATALATLDEANTHAAEAGEPYLLAEIALRRAYCLHALERGDALRAAAAYARELCRPLGGDRLVAACLLFGAASSDPAEALAACDEAVAAARSIRAELDARLARGRALVTQGRAEQAVDDFVEVVAGSTELGRAEEAAFGRFELAAAYRQAGRYAEAAEAAEEGVAALSALGAQEAADRCRFLLATIYRQLGEDDTAVELLDGLAANLDGFDNLASRGQVLEETGEILYQRDRDALAAARFAAAVDAYTRAGLPLDELRARRRWALALRWSGDVEGAVGALAQTDARAAGLPAELAEEPAAEWERAMLAYDGAKVLAGAKRTEDALQRVADLPGRFERIGAFAEAVLAELLIGELLLATGRTPEAEPVLRRALAALPRDAEPLRRAAWLLSETLARLGRDAEAAAVRAEHDLADPDQ